MASGATGATTSAHDRSSSWIDLVDADVEDLAGDDPGGRGGVVRLAVAHLVGRAQAVDPEAGGLHDRLERHEDDRAAAVGVPEGQERQRRQLPLGIGLDHHRGGGRGHELLVAGLAGCGAVVAGRAVGALGHQPVAGASQQRDGHDEGDQGDAERHPSPGRWPRRRRHHPTGPLTGAGGLRPRAASAMTAAVTTSSGSDAPSDRAAAGVVGPDAVRDPAPTSASASAPDGRRRRCRLRLAASPFEPADAAVAADAAVGRPGRSGLGTVGAGVAVAGRPRPRAARMGASTSRSGIRPARPRSSRGRRRRRVVVGCARGAGARVHPPGRGGGSRRRGGSAVWCAAAPKSSAQR